MNWEDLTYLLSMEKTQVQAYHALKELGLMEDLKAYDPVLVGTVPININIEGSDLDVVCYVEDLEAFKNLVGELYGGLKGFSVRQVDGLRGQACVVNFYYQSFEIEVYGQNIPSKKQNAYRHMDIENRLLKLGTDPFRNHVVKSKMDGLKTEPAFAKLLNLQGDPYKALLDLEGLSDMDLLEVLRKNQYGG